MPNKNTQKKIQQSFQLILKNHADLFIGCSKQDVWNFVCDMEINELSQQGDFYYPYEEESTLQHNFLN